MEQKQKMRYDDKELSLIKATFADNDDTLLAVRKAFLQVEFTDEDVKKLEHITKSKDALAVIRKAYAPSLELEAPFGQMIDLWMTIDTKEITPAQTTLALLVRESMHKLLEHGLKRLEDPKTEVIEGIADYTPDFEMSDEERYVTYVARNSLITHSEQRLQELSFLAGRKDETVEETLKRLQQNSAK